jgi:hypothetical protein
MVQRPVVRLKLVLRPRILASIERESFGTPWKPFGAGRFVTPIKTAIETAIGSSDKPPLVAILTMIFRIARDIPLSAAVGRTG